MAGDPPTGSTLDPPVYTIDDVERARLAFQLQFQIDARRDRTPGEWYIPSTPTPEKPFANQLAFHQAPHALRMMAPGNGWGKTTAAGAEVNAWGHHTNQWQLTPPWPVLMIWFCKLYEQFELIRQQLRADIFGHGVKETKDGYTWPDGSMLVLGSADQPNSWKKWQGVPVDLIVFDEFPPLALWREMYMRRRAKRKTRYVIGATATEGEVWAETELYNPWLKHHKDLGLTEEEALFVQSHPWIWCWSIGGIADNPAADQADIDWYAQSQWSNPKEKMVRLRGGFQSWVGEPVFADEGVDWIRKQADLLDAQKGEGMKGWIEPAPPGWKPPPAPPKRPAPPLRVGR